MNYQPPLDDIHFILHDVLEAPAQLQALPSFADIDADLMRQVAHEAGKFVAAQVAPLQAVGDSIGCQFANGKVTTPPGFKETYQAFWQGGWPALACAPEDGGQGLPAVLDAVLYEMLSAANHGWTMAPGLLHGAYECIRHHGSEALKAQYLEKIASGQWLATMCLTEAHAGSDLGLVRTRAVAQVDGSYRISGTKIFISGGEHDLTDNIVHLVLARLPDAPAGPKGLSLFLAPKLMPDGTANAICCERIEEKMGLHGSATCVMRFDAAAGWLIGEPNRGLNAMFVMMNAARLHVGLQGIGLLEAAWQKADAYSKERRQMRAPRQPMSTTPDLIAEHPAIRRILATQRAWIDGGRVLAYRTAIELDLARQHPDADRRRSAEQWCSLVTPVLKAAWTAQAFYGSSECLQVFGGHGYIREWGMEQLARDARIAPIYEGTNGIQALDLLGRKVLGSQGKLLRGFTKIVHKFCGANAEHPQLKAQVALLNQLNQEWGELTTRVGMAAMKNPDEVGAAAVDYLMYSGYIILAYLWLRMAIAAQALDDAEFAQAKLAACDFYFKRLLPRTGMHRAAVEAGSDCLMSLPANAFAL